MIHNLIVSNTAESNVQCKVTGSWKVCTVQCLLHSYQKKTKFIGWSPVVHSSMLCLVGSYTVLLQMQHHEQVEFVQEQREFEQPEAGGENIGRTWVGGSTLTGSLGGDKTGSG